MILVYWHITICFMGMLVQKTKLTQSCLNIYSFKHISFFILLYLYTILQPLNNV